MALPVGTAFSKVNHSVVGRKIPTPARRLPSAVARFSGSAAHKQSQGCRLHGRPKSGIPVSPRFCIFPSGSRHSIRAFLGPHVPGLDSLLGIWSVRPLQYLSCHTAVLHPSHVSTAQGFRISRRNDRTPCDSVLSFVSLLSPCKTGVNPNGCSLRIANGKEFLSHNGNCKTCRQVSQSEVRGDICELFQ